MRALVAVCLLLLAAPAFAEDREYDLGFARPGMALDQFRAGAWPNGARVFCSDDEDRPRGHDNFALSKGLAGLGAARCGVFSQDQGKWTPHRMEVAGTTTEVWGLFLPAGDGARRMVQLTLNPPAESFEALYRLWAELLGPPSEKRAKLARWSNGRNDAAIINDGGRCVQAFVVDNRLQATMNARMHAKK